MPPRLRRRRDAVLTAITEEVATAAPKDWKGDAPQPDDPLSPVNLNRLFYPHWEGKGNWIHSKKHPRSDEKKQPSKEVLTAVLWYLRDMIRLGIEQLVYATLLYETAIQDVDYVNL
jgi:hypothetical protein